MGAAQESDDPETLEHVAGLILQKALRVEDIICEILEADSAPSESSEIEKDACATRAERNR